MVSEVIPDESLPSFAPGLVDHVGAQIDIQIGPQAASAFPGLPRLRCLVAKAAYVIQEFPLLVCGKRSDRIEDLLFQSHWKPDLPTLSVVLAFSERRRRTLRGPSIKRFLMNRAR
jgi:hypothetical protein